MSEKIRPDHESHDVIDDSFFEEHRKSLEEASKRNEREPSHPEKSIESILTTIEKTATSTKELAYEQPKHEQKPANTRLNVGQDLAHHGYNQTMKKVRKELPSHQRALSKIIHAPLIETTSAVLGETVARPSGLLAGGIFSFFTNLLVVGVCRYYGYEYNYLVGLLSFAGGFLVGLLIELAYRTTHHKRKR